jgi:glycosyltransferase involved in cell wall biosynthesis
LASQISIVVTNHNKGRFIESALNSALTQSIRDFDMVVVDDASTDDSVSLIERVRSTDSRLSLVIQEKNKGQSAALNEGIRRAKSRYITFLDSDDLFAPERLETLCKRLVELNGKAVVYSDWVDVGEHETAVVAKMSTASFRPSGMIFPDLIAGRFRFTALPIALPRSFFDAVGMYDETLRWGQDHEMALRLSSAYPFVFERLSTYGYRQHPQNTYRTFDKKARYLQQTQIMNKHLMKNLKSLDSETKRLAFNNLFGYMMSSGQWTRVVRTSLVDRQAFVSMITIPARVRRSR